MRKDDMTELNELTLENCRAVIDDTLKKNYEVRPHGEIRSLVRERNGPWAAADILDFIMEWYKKSRHQIMKDEWKIWRSRKEMADITGLSITQLDRASSWLEKEGIITKEQHFWYGKNITHWRICDDWRRVFLTIYDREAVAAVRTKALKAQKKAIGDLTGLSPEKAKAREKAGKKAFWRVVDDHLRPIKEYDPE